MLDWVNYEIEGYPDDVEIPDYRVIGGQLYGTYFKGSLANHIIYNHVPLPLGNLPVEIKEDILTIKIRQGIEALKGFIAESEKNDNSGLIKPIPAEYYPYIAQANNDLGMMITTASVELNMPKVLNIFPKVNDPTKISQNLDKYYNENNHINFHRQLILFGRNICTARNPKCNICPCSKNLCKQKN